MENKKLYRSQKNKMICGVAGGLGEHLNVDPTVIRLLFVAVSLMAGTGILIYLAAAIIIPLAPNEHE